MEHHATAKFWRAFDALPADVRRRADKQFALLKADSQHSSLQFKKVGERDGVDVWSARVTLKYRVFALRQEDSCFWFWIGEHREYETLI
jgi:hypothetical protein